MLGEKILKEKSVPQINLFSYTAPDFPTPNHHWLGEVFLYLGSLFGGLRGLIIFKALVLSGAFILAIFAFKKKGGDVLAVFMGLNAIFILIDRTYVRPEIFSFLFLGWYLFVLFRQDSKKLLFTLPFIQLIWVNTHIYFFIGPVIYAIFLIQYYITIKTFKLKDQTILIGLIIALVNFINPTSWVGALYPVFVFNNYAIPILENISPFGLGAYSYPSLALWALSIGMVISVIGFIVNRKKIKNNIFELGIIIIGVILALIMIRNVPIFALIMLPVNIKNFYEAGFRPNNKAIVFGIIILLFILIQYVTNSKIYEMARYNRTFGLNIPTYGENAIRFIKENNLHGPIFNNINAGSYLIWKLPEEKVFVDTRPEAYPDYFIRDEYIAMQKDPEKWETYSEKYNINLVFYAWIETKYTDWANAFLKNISNNKNWGLVYLDDNITIFLKNTPENSEIIEKYLIEANYK
ncbi:MAG: hypothetical protein Q7K65_05290 [Candidatus Buchananbacteria bacterium]|nr:hypothetical protein [Candidatus Buchananbacteria bacterium]